jgi:SEC-C motif-containing protein
MRSRYAAFVVGDAAYLRRTWAPATRPRRIGLDPDTRWTGLEILGSTSDGDAATVEFRAHHAGGVLHENSRFSRADGRWYYLDGDLTGG